MDRTVRYDRTMPDYEYAGVPLSPTVFAAVALRVAPRDKPLSRPDLIDLVVAEHEAKGGIAARGSLISAAKKALSTLVADGRVKNPAYGYWRFIDPLTPGEVDEPVELGEGKESVYVYYFPAYRDQAAYLERDAWPMKIGMTTGELKPRVRDQVGTAMPERPIVGLIYRTSAASNAEKLLHSTLEARGRRLADAPGKEWFMTGLNEVREILEFATTR